MSTVEQTGLLLALATALASIVGTFLLYIQIRNSNLDKIEDGIEKLAKLEARVEVIWAFLLRRAASESINNGLGTMNSPFMPNAKAYLWFDGLKKDLEQFYISHSTKSDLDLALEIESMFGDRILKEVCIPNRFSTGECLLIATSIAKGGKAVDLGSINAKC